MNSSRIFLYTKNFQVFIQFYTIFWLLHTSEFMCKIWITYYLVSVQQISKFNHFFFLTIEKWASSTCHFAVGRYLLSVIKINIYFCEAIGFPLQVFTPSLV